MKNSFSKSVGFSLPFRLRSISGLFFIAGVVTIYTLFVCTMSDEALATEWYLDGSAQGLNNGTSWTDAWTVPSNITLNSIKAGDTLWIQGGSYSEALFFISNPGIEVRIAPTASYPAVFQNLHVYDCDGIVIDGLLNEVQMLKFTKRHPTLGHAVNLRRSLPIVLKGVHIDRSSEYIQDAAQNHGIRVWDSCGNVIIENCLIENTTGDGINITQVDYTGCPESSFDWIFIKENVIQKVGDDGVQIGNSRIKLIRNTIHNPLLGYEAWGHRDGFQMNPDNKYAWIEGNFIKDMLQYVFIEYATGYIRVINNIFVDGETEGVNRGINSSVRNSIDFVGNFVVANNIFYNFLSYAAINGAFTATGDGKTILENNIFLNCRVGINDIAQASHIGQYNIWWDESGVKFYSTDGHAIDTPVSRKFGFAVNINPLISTDTFRLNQGSPALQTGQVLSSYFTLDREGIDRGTTAWDKGPYQLSNQSHSDPPSVPSNLRIAE